MVAAAFQALHEMVHAPQPAPGVQPQAPGDETAREETPDGPLYAAGPSQTAQPDLDPDAAHDTDPTNAWASERIDLDLGPDWYGYDGDEAGYLLDQLTSRH